MKKRIKIRKGSPLWYMNKYWIVALFWITVFALGYVSITTLVNTIYADAPEVVVTTPAPLKPYIPPVPKPIVVVAVAHTPTQLGTQHFSRGGYTERRISNGHKYSNNDVILLASILERECPSEDRLPDWDRRLEANVIVNRHEHHGGTLKSIIEAGNGTQFNGIRTKGYKNREYSQESYDAAYAVLILGQRVLDDDIRYFSNLSTSTDRDFIDSIDWVLKQNSKYGHSFGRAK